jgi:hypothetical protein
MSISYIAITRSAIGTWRLNPGALADIGVDRVHVGMVTRVTTERYGC